jgi:ACS family hexuronate transporter-like MFS transporter
MKFDKIARTLTPWQWLVTGLLLMATMLNYMDRQTLANLSVRITSDLGLSQERYGTLELGFGWSFAFGLVFFGTLADRFPVRWLYPAVVIGWSMVGLLTGFSSSYQEMLICRMLLGFFESGHWPCALKTTQVVLSREQRIFGNSILQSGAAIGAIVTPLVIRGMVGDSVATGAWRPPFIVIGAIGGLWVLAWLLSIRREHLPAGSAANQSNSNATVVQPEKESIFQIWWNSCIVNRRFWALLPMVICFNITWQLIRVWLPKFLQQGRGATEAQSLYFNSLYYIAADIGCITAGAAGVWLVSRGISVLRSRQIVLTVGATLTALSLFIPVLPLGYGLYALLLVIAAASLGIFPCYYSLAQEVSHRHMGKATGLLGCASWLISSPLQKYFGRIVDQTGSFDTGMSFAGLAPGLALVIWFVLWPVEDEIKMNVTE